MEKVKIDNKTRLFPMPMVVVGAVVEGRINYMAVAWVSRVNPDPPMIGVALGKGHHTNKGIREHKEFSISIPGVDLMKAVDYVGLISGAKADKSKVFESFQGVLQYAPMIRNCPLTVECRVVTTVDLPGNENLQRSSQNLERVELLSSRELTPYHLLKYDRLMISRPAVEKLQEALAP